MVARRKSTAHVKPEAWSALVAVALCSAGCLVPEPEDRGGPVRTPPVFDLAKAEPFVGSVIVIDSSKSRSVAVTVPVRSDDRGTALLGSFYVDFGHADIERPLAQQDLSPSTIDDLSRKFDMDVVLDSRPPGCWQLSLLATHLDNWDYSKGRPKWPEALSDTALATWWLNVDPLRGEEATLLNCPNPSAEGPQ